MLVTITRVPNTPPPPQPPAEGELHHPFCSDATLACAHPTPRERASSFSEARVSPHPGSGSEKGAPPRSHTPAPPSVYSAAPAVL